MECAMVTIFSYLVIAVVLVLQLLFLVQLLHQSLTPSLSDFLPRAGLIWLTFVLDTLGHDTPLTSLGSLDDAPLLLSTLALALVLIVVATFEDCIASFL